ncbi:MAG: class I SAM-dependent methyltransferase [Proteobacteria bacterium]|nr:class I SAM-dependent methyltransferase [Pseudomonadota bacterium]
MCFMATPETAGQNAAGDLAGRYLDLLAKSLSNGIYGESRLEMRLLRIRQRLRHPIASRRGAIPWPSRAHTMIGPVRLRNIRDLIERTLREGVQGDYIETGIWRGGACIYMRGILAAHGIGERRVYCADSFAGLPAPTAAKYPADKRDRSHVYEELAITLDEVRKNFAAYGLLDEQVVFVKGYFRDTLPKLVGHRFALLRLDGDMYESTMDALLNLYGGLSAGGFVIVDDYGGITACRRAVHDFLAARSLAPEIHKLDVSCVWWQKT